MAFEVSSVPLSLGDPIEFAGNAQTGERGVYDQAEAFPREVIDQRQNAEAPAAHQCVGHEVERPAQVTILRDSHWRPGAEGSFASAALAHGQPLLLVEPIKLLGVELDALTLQHQPQAPVAKAAPL